MFGFSELIQRNATLHEPAMVVLTPISAFAFIQHFWCRSERLSEYVGFQVHFVRKLQYSAVKPFALTVAVLEYKNSLGLAMGYILTDVFCFFGKDDFNA